MSDPTSVFEMLPPSEVTTLVRGATVALSTRTGTIRPAALLGVFHRDERLLSSLRFTVDGVEPALLAAHRSGPARERVASLVAVDRYGNGQAILVRRRLVTVGSVVEEIEVRSFGGARTIELELALESDGASVLSLKGREAPPRGLNWLVSGGRRAVSRRDGMDFAAVEVDERGSLSAAGSVLHVSWKPEMQGGAAWTARWSVVAIDAVIETRSRPGVGATRKAQPRAPEGEYAHEPALVIEADDHRWAPALASAVADLDALVIELPERGLRFIGAGAPWYQALFGRDSLIAAWESLPLGTALALDVLDTLAAFQGAAYDERTREAPGKIVHEWRIGAPQVFGMDGGDAYYGSVDASALFVMLLTEAYRWGAPIDRVRALLPAARAALQWCRGDAVAPEGRDRGPFVWYTPDPHGLGNQGWKDSGDSIVHSDGSVAVGPIAVAEAQAYVFEALQGMARLERDLGDRRDVADAHEADARSLSAAFVERFWLSDVGLVALALDGEGEPLCVASSNMGQCLWSGILPPSIAARVVQRTMASDLLTPWGIRTLGDRERAYNPLGYHLGTVWAHDSAIIAAGCGRHGFGDALRTLTDGLLDAAEKFGWRLPELYGGLDTSADGAPLPYPAACSPQAWSAGAPLLLLRAVLGLEPDVPAERFTAHPLLPEGQCLTVSGLRIGNRNVSISARGNEIVSTSGLRGLTRT